MTTPELKKKILEATDFEWFNNLNETFNFPYINFSQQLKSLSAIYEFVNQQLKGWESYKETLPRELQNSKSYFLNIQQQIIHFVNSYLNQPSNNLTAYWQNIAQAIRNINNKPLCYNSPETEFLIKISTENPNYFRGAYNFIVGINQNVNEREILFGSILAYEFILRDKSEIVNKRKAEQNSMTKLRADFQKYINESDKLLNTHLKNANNAYNEHVTKLDSLKNEKDTLFTTWFENTKNEEWQKWYDPVKKKISELETTYREKLKFEEPAKYWDNRANKLKKQGWIALAVMVILISIACFSLGKILWNTPEQIYASWFQGDKSAAIRWAIVYISLLSFIVFAIRAVNKVMFSSFHLARDCEERYTLTYFYLALLKDSKVDEKDRQLIMQSLFSRAETGLLNEDSSPTMPSDTITKLISK